MKMPIKAILSFIILSFTIFSACKKDDVDTYELTLKATKSSNGSSTFTEIKYMDGNKAVQTVTNSSTDFSTKFVIADGFAINFSVKGSASGGTATTLPTPTISYLVEKVTNGTTRESLCNELEASIKGANGSYSFEKVFTKTFISGGCK